MQDFKLGYTDRGNYEHNQREDMVNQWEPQDLERGHNGSDFYKEGALNSKKMINQ